MLLITGPPFMSNKEVGYFSFWPPKKCSGLKRFLVLFSLGKWKSSTWPVLACVCVFDPDRSENKWFTTLRVALAGTLDTLLFSSNLLKSFKPLCPVNPVPQTDKTWIIRKIIDIFFNCHLAAFKNFGRIISLEQQCAQSDDRLLNFGRKQKFQL